jgi:hypothetical protein
MFVGLMSAAIGPGTGCARTYEPLVVRQVAADVVGVVYNWRMKATSAAFSRGVICTPRTRSKNSAAASYAHATAQRCARPRNPLPRSRTNRTLNPI